MSPITTLGRSSARTVAPRLARGYAGGGPHYYQPSGYLFGEKPLAPGQKRVKGSWENLYYYGFVTTCLVAAVGLYYKPKTGVQFWAREEAMRRMKESGEWEKIEYKPSMNPGSIYSK